MKYITFKIQNLAHSSLRFTINIRNLCDFEEPGIDQSAEKIVL